jgi:cytochrome c
MHKFLLSIFMAAGFVAAAAQAEDLGSKSFATCAACHSVKEGENGTGPSLHNLIGRKAGTVEGFRYSGPMKRSGITWDHDTLTAFLRAPQESVPGNRMPFSGVADEAELKALVSYLEANTR